MVRMKTVWLLSALFVFLLGGCDTRSMLDIPCRTDDDCPTYFICLNSGVCHLPDNSVELLDGDTPWPFNGDYIPELCEPDALCADRCEGHHLIHCEATEDFSLVDCDQNNCSCKVARLCREGCLEQNGVGRCVEDQGDDPFYCDRFDGGCFEGADPLLSGSTCQGGSIYLAEPIASLEDPCLLECNKTLVEVCNSERCRQESTTLALCRSNDCVELNGGCFPDHDPRTTGLSCRDGDIYFGQSELTSSQGCTYDCDWTLYEECPSHHCYQVSTTAAQCVDDICPNPLTGCVPGFPEESISRCDANNTHVIFYENVPSQLDPCVLECAAISSETCPVDQSCVTLSDFEAACMYQCEYFTGGCDPNDQYGNVPGDETVYACDANTHRAVVIGTPTLDYSTCSAQCSWSTGEVCRDDEYCFHDVEDNYAYCNTCDSITGGCAGHDESSPAYQCSLRDLYIGYSHWIGDCTFDCNWSYFRTCSQGCTDHGDGIAYCNEDDECIFGYSGGCFPDDESWPITESGLNCTDNAIVSAIPVLSSSDPCRYDCRYQVVRYCDPGQCESRQTGEAICNYCQDPIGGCFSNDPDFPVSQEGTRCIGQHIYRGTPILDADTCHYSCEWNFVENCSPSDCVEVATGEATCAQCSSMTGGCTEYNPNLAANESGEVCLGNILYSLEARQQENNPCHYDCLMRGLESCETCQTDADGSSTCVEPCTNLQGGCDEDDNLVGGIVCMGGTLYRAYPVLQNEHNSCLLDCQVDFITHCPNGTCSQVDDYYAVCD